MQCPNCQHENPESAKFCVECGEKFEKKCPACGFSNSPSYKFCAECGYNLAQPSEPLTKELSFDEKIEKIQKYLPGGVTEKVLAQRGKIEGEKKQVTVLFTDLEGFTPLVERIGPEEAYSIIDQVYEILIHKVHDYEGTVNEMTGDGIVALFGAPIALEDAPQRAIRSAYAIHREMVRFSDKIKQEKGGIPPFKTRVGIHTGPVVVGTLGNDLRVEFKAVGDTVNLAARMQDLAAPGSTYVTEDTFKLTEGIFAFEALGARRVKGKEEPVKVYRVIAPSTRRTRFDVSAERGLTPLAGRERELELLLDAFERAKASRGQVMSIVSDAGVGKSRLLYEFRKAVSNEDVLFLEGKCLSYSRNVAYHPVADMLKSNFDIQEEDNDSTITEKVKRGLKILASDETSTLPYLLELLSVKDSGIDKILMSHEARGHKIAETLHHIVLKGSEIRPLILAFEDLHWIDISSEESLKGLIDKISGARVFLIITYRPEFVGTWGGKSYHSQVNLNRLSKRESLAMVASLFFTENIASDLEEMILEKTEGVPFFIEEFVRSLRDLKIIKRTDSMYHLEKDVQSVPIPSTIQDVIMARVDSLPEDVKGVLQTGSVIEREFSYELIRQVMGLPEKELITHLSALKDSELIYERGIHPETTYIFKHALTREVVYDSILSRKRKKLHEEVAHAVEDTWKENIGEHLAALTEHFIKAENYEKGVEYAKLTSKKAQRAGSFADAIEYRKKGLFCLERLPKTEANQKRIIDERTAIAAYHVNLTNVFEATQSIRSIVDLAMSISYEKKLPVIYNVMALSNFFIEENFTQGFRYFDQAIEFSVRENDYLSLWMGNYYMGTFLSWNCEFEKGLSCFEKCQHISELAKNPIGVVTSKSIMTIINYAICGKIDLAYKTGYEALRLAKETDDILAKGLAHTGCGAACYYKGLFADAENDFLTGANFCEQIKSIMWLAIAYNYLGLLFFDMGNCQRAEGFFKKAISTMEVVRIIPSWVSFWKLCVIRIDVLNNILDIHLSELFEILYTNIKICCLQGLAAKFIGDILLHIDDQHMNEAEKWIKKAIEADERNGMMWHVGRDYVLYAELFKRKGDQSKAKENLSKAIEILKECGADGWVKKYEKELAALS